MSVNRCPDCGGVQWSLVDQQYVVLFDTCRDDDIKRWKGGDLTLHALEKREKAALASAVETNAP